MNPREQPGLQPPGERSLEGFPRTLVASSDVLYRAHRADLGPWWFSSEGGRFDLPEPRGTCYLARTAATAVREVLGMVLTAGRAVPSEFLRRRVVSCVSLPVAADMADVGADAAAAFGLTRELATLTPYTVPRQWAEAFARAGYNGIVYPSRFTTGPEAAAVAVFGRAGAREWAGDPSPRPLAAVAAEAGVRAAGAPRRVRIVEPPDRGGSR